MQKSIFLVLLALALPLSLLAHGGTDDENNIIRMTKNGFEPKELTVTEGDEVLFINNDDVDRWPASNFHPTHTLYPEFDPKGHIKPGESWKFVFDKPGTWRMHDHLFPHMTGTIVVLEEPSSLLPTTATNSPEAAQNIGFFAHLKAFLAHLWKKIAPSKGAAETSNSVNQKLLAEFKSQSEQDKYAWLQNIAARESPKVAWQYVLAAYQTPAGVVGNPHDMAHLVGQLLYKSYGFDGLATCTPVFAFGCYHGLMEVAFDQYKGGSGKAYHDGILEAKTGCQTVGPDTSPAYWSCIHGMGHGIITFREHDLAKALNDCDILDNEIRTYCHDGVFMELSISAPANFYKKSDPLYPCDTIRESYKVACARSQVQVMRQKFNLGTGAIADVCRKSDNANITYHCVDALGYFIGQGSPGNADKILSGCREIVNASDAAQCSAAAAGELVFQDSAGWQTTSEAVCQGLASPYQASCRERVSQVKQSYGRK